MSCAVNARMQETAWDTGCMKRLSENASSVMISLEGKAGCRDKMLLIHKKSGHSFRSGLNISPPYGINHLTAG